MNGRPHFFSFGPRPATPVTSFPSSLASPPPLSRLILDCSRPPLRPLLLRHPHYYSLSGASLSISPHRTFSSSPFFLGTRRRLPFVLVSHPLFHGRAFRTKRARVASALPGNVLTTSVLLFLRRSARLLSRARSLFCHYPLCFLHILRSFSLFPRFYQRASFSIDDFPSLLSSDRT